jgi:FMN phosphatase YigB (HAD superfamily)
MEKAGIQPQRFSKLVFGSKPSKKSDYQSVLDELDVDPKQAMVIADRVSVDLSPAKELGMFTVHFPNGRGKVHNGPSSDVDVRIETLQEVLKLV